MVLLALRFDWTVDLTGLATVLLALATAVLALMTRSAAAATATEAATAARELEASQRPVLVPLGLVNRGRRDTLNVEVQNVGPGAALNVAIMTASRDGRHLTAVEPSLPPIGPGDMTDFEVPVDRVEPESSKRDALRLHIEYEDVAGAAYCTDAHIIVIPTEVAHVAVRRVRPAPSE